MMFVLCFRIKSLRCTNNHFSKIDHQNKNRFIEGENVDIGDNTFFKNVKRFPQSHYCVVETGKAIDLSFIKYWSPPNNIREINEKRCY